MANYFNYFPTTPYSFDGVNIQFAKNILSKISFEKEFRENTVIYYEYFVGDGETPEIVSHKVYGSSEKHWIILLLNEILHPQYDWPLSSFSFYSYIDAKYRQAEYANTNILGDGITWSQSNIKDYIIIETKTNNSLEEVISTQNYYVTSNIYANTVTSSENYTLQDGTSINLKIEKQTKNYYDYESELNESKRSIKILKPEFVSSVEQEFVGIFK